MAVDINARINLSLMSVTCSCSQLELEASITWLNARFSTLYVTNMCTMNARTVPTSRRPLQHQPTKHLHYVTNNIKIPGYNITITEKLLNNRAKKIQHNELFTFWAVNTNEQTVSDRKIMIWCHWVHNTLSEHCRYVKNALSTIVDSQPELLVWVKNMNVAKNGPKCMILKATRMYGFNSLLSLLTTLSQQQQHITNYYFQRSDSLKIFHFRLTLQQSNKWKLFNIAVKNFFLF